MVDFSSLTDKELRELLLKFEPNAPPVNANTRSAVERQLRRFYAEDASVNTSFAVETDDRENSTRSLDDTDNQSTELPQQSTPMTVRFDPLSDRKYEYDRTYTPSYCRKSLNEYRDKASDMPTYNLLDRPGCTPHTKKNSLTANSTSSKTKDTVSKPSSSFAGKLMIILVLCITIIGVYFIVTWDPSFGVPFQTSDL